MTTDISFGMITLMSSTTVDLWYSVSVLCMIRLVLYPVTWTCIKLFDGTGSAGSVPGRDNTILLDVATH